MPDLREAFRLSTDHVAPEPGALDRQLRRQRGRTTRRKASAFAAAAAVLTLVAAVIFATQPGGEDDRIAVPAPPGGLFSLDVTTGEMTPFHDPGDGTWRFELSPDGTKLLMTYDVPGTSDEHQIWIADDDGTNARVLVEGDATYGTWFPDSRRIAYSGLGFGDNRQIKILDIETGERRQATSEPQDVADLTVSPDGRSIVYTTTAPSIVEEIYVDFQGVVPSAPPVGLLKRVDLGTGETVTLYRQRAGWVYNPRISSATGEITFGEWASDYPSMDAKDSSIYLIPLEGGTATLFVARDEAVDRIFVDAPNWSPDGSLLAYMVEGASGEQSTWVYNVASEEHRRIGPGWPETWLDDDTILVGT